MSMVCSGSGRPMLLTLGDRASYASRMEIKLKLARSVDLCIVYP